MVTHTPVTHWMSIPWADACAWAETVIRVNEENKAASKGSG